MTSITTYKEITPTYLYIKQHSITGLKYYGKTIKDPYKYSGSGIDWTKHINDFGKEHIVTLYTELFTDSRITEVALKFSVDNNIVESIEWANLIPETGVDGGTGNTGKKHSSETKSKISAAKKGRPSPKKGVPISDEQKAKMSAAKRGIKWTEEAKAKQRKSKENYITSQETIEKIRAAHLGKKHSNEAKAKISATKTGKKHSNETKAKISESAKKRIQIIVKCPHCVKIGSLAQMKQWHFDNCKSLNLTN